VAVKLKLALLELLALAARDGRVRAWYRAAWYPPSRCSWPGRVGVAGRIGGAHLESVAAVGQAAIALRLVQAAKALASSRQAKVLPPRWP